MNTFNLLPASRQAANRRRRAKRRWVRINCTYGVLLATVGLVYFLSSSPTPIAAVQVQPLPDLRALNTQLIALRTTSVALAADLRSTSDLADRPDWSRLLTAFARTLGDDAVLTAVDGVSPADSKSDNGPTRFTLTGVAGSQAAVTQLVLRIEAFGLFSKVGLTRTSVMPAGDSNGVGFQLVCTLFEGGQ